MFKNVSPVRQKFLERYEPAIKAAEAKYEERKNDLIEKHAAEIERLYASHSAQHDLLLEEMVKSI